MRSIIAALIICLASSTASAWTEKWPVDIKLSTSNFLSEFLRANFGKVGEVAAKQLDAILNDPQKQAKLAASVVKKLNDIYDKYQRDRAANEQAAKDAAAREFIALVEADMLAGPVSGQFNTEAAYSAQYGAVRLKWDRQINRSACQRSVCTCPDGSSVPGPGYFCYTQTPYGQTSQPASCTFPTDYVDTEAEYKVYRNSKPIATFAGAKSVSSGSSGSVGFNIGPVSVSLTGTLPPATLGPAGRAGPFYDFDPQNTNYGTQLRYTIEARSVGCSEPYAPGKYYNNTYTGMINTSTTIVVDADGDARPDFYPEGRFFLSRVSPSPHVSIHNPTDDYIVWYWQAQYEKIRVNISGSNPTGTVKYYTNGLLKLTANVVNGVSEVRLLDLSSGSDDFTVTAVYSGDANNPAGSSVNTYVSLYRD